jgi:hypothetical protein
VYSWASGDAVLQLAAPKLMARRGGCRRRDSGSGSGITMLLLDPAAAAVAARAGDAVGVVSAAAAAGVTSAELKHIVACSIS